MKIAFFPSGCIPFHARSLDERPLGGTETGLIRLSQELSLLGHEVVVFSPLENPPLSEPLYLPVSAINDLGPVDVFVAVREWSPLFLSVDARIRLFWSGDSYDQPQNLGMGDPRVYEKIDAFLAVSNWHGQRLSEESGFPIEKVWPIRNGIHLPYFDGSEQRVRKRMIYSSTPYRGLVHLPPLYQAIKRIHPDAELHVFSGYAVYAGPQGYDERAVQEFKQLADVLNRLPDCTVHGNIQQSALAREFMKSSVLAYPNTFEETSCMTAMEAQAAGCVPVTSQLAALPETIGDAGALIPSTAGSEEYSAAFIQAVDRLFSDDTLFERLSRRGKERARHFGWDTVARRFVQYLQQAHGIQAASSGRQATGNGR